MTPLLPALGAQFQIKQYDVPLTNGTVTQVTGQNGNRYAIVFTNNVAVACFLFFGQSVSGLTGVPVLQGQFPITFAWESTGGLCQLPIYATCNPATSTLSVVEVLWIPQLSPNDEVNRE